MDIKNPFGGSRKGEGKDETFKNMIRYGKVSSVNPATVSARVAFADKSGVVSHDLPIIVPGSLKNKHYHIPDIGEDVVCLFLPNGIQRGFVLGSFYNVNNTPPVDSEDKEHVTFSDGTVVEYDRNSHTFMMDIQGTANITTAGSTNITATGGVSVTGNVNVTGNVTVTGALEVSEGITATGDMTTNGGITASSDITAGGISLQLHVHSGVQSGGNNTSGPTG